MLSYASSPPFTIPKGESKPTTSALLDTCFRQVEYAGVLKGAKNPKGAAGVHRLHGAEVLPGGAARQHVRLPRRPARALPADWAKYAKVAPKPYTVAPAEIAKNRDAWLREWSDVTTR